MVFFTDTAEEGTSAELRAPVIAHTFKPSEFERIFSGGNWRAVPILRALAEHFFSAPAQARFAARRKSKKGGKGGNNVRNAMRKLVDTLRHVVGGE